MIDCIKFLIDKYLLKTQAWVALMFALLCSFFSQNQLKSNNFLFAFCITLAAYNFIIYYTFWLRKKLLFPYFLIFFLTSSFSFYQILSHKDYNIYLLIVCFCIVILYRFIRNFSFLKNILIAICWSLAILAISEFSFSKFFVLALFIFGFAIPFDWKNDYDKEDRELICYKTTHLGRAKNSTANQTVQHAPNKHLYLGATKTISLSSIFISSILSWFLISDFRFNLIWSISLSIAMLIIYFANSLRSKFYFSFWLEGVSALPFLLTIFFK